MKEDINVYARNPKVLRKLVRFTGYVPANIIDKNKNLIAAGKVPMERQQELLKARDHKDMVDICYEGKRYHTQIAKIFMNDAEHAIDEIDLAVVS